MSAQSLAARLAKIEARMQAVVEHQEMTLADLVHAAHMLGVANGEEWALKWAASQPATSLQTQPHRQSPVGRPPSLVDLIAATGSRTEEQPQ